ncbi:UDP-glycosyltransferase 73C5 [Striga hermonthica]|uniref:Glycosyltransferase n=1 Tax=Striga hermonthica TaxID=68872 RepID=A0A9N7NGY1_STRHE|nr:UDP-glycosyltransferase 73C5 [Striga hermonthica]
MASQPPQLHFILFPLMAPGHTIPMIDIAKLLARRHTAVSIITTPRNATRFGSSIDRAAQSGLRINLIRIQFPSVEAGLPDGCENLDALPSLDMATNFFTALNLLQKEVHQVFDEMFPRPSCIISDMGLPWTTQLAEKHGIPRIVFHGTCCLSLLCSHNIRSSGILDTLSSEDDPFEVPGVPGQIMIRKSQLAGSAMKKPSAVIKDVTEQIRAAEKTSFGVIVNSFVELEPDYVKAYSWAKGERVWCVGPVALSNEDRLDLAERGIGSSASPEHDCLKWLDRKQPGSVVYASLGSLARLTREQMAELGLGLEESNRPFLWALGGGMSDELERWLSEDGFEERTKDRGFLIRGWAPQVLILAHKAVGGFVTHCGWNSTLEGITAGVPMATWPFFADQFMNEKLVVRILGVGVSFGVEVPVRWGEEDKVGVLVRREDVVRVVGSLMDEGAEEGKERRKKAGELAEKARRAVEEGGSSFLNVGMLIEEIRGSVG